MFKSLPQEEKVFWHSHKHEVESGLLQLFTKSFVPGAATDFAEKPTMSHLQKTYGKTIHTWMYDKYPDIPLGPPTLMLASTCDAQGPPADMVKKRDHDSNQDSAAKKEARKEYLSPYEAVKDSDELQKSGRGVVFEVREVEAKK
uniref:Map kinase n=1 Tax=Ganoderma boninense TaxID=34458 RepID=A0A5K1K0D0_9APHY|nr:Map kinase [Ganoderma boninense]